LINVGGDVGEFNMKIAGPAEKTLRVGLLVLFTMVQNGAVLQYYSTFSGNLSKCFKWFSVFLPICISFNGIRKWWAREEWMANWWINELWFQFLSYEGVFPPAR